MKANIFDSSEAAKYLGLSPNTVRKYVQRSLLRPCKTVARAYLFSTQELDRYKREKRPAGKPKKA